MGDKPWQEHYDYNVPTTIRYPKMPVQNLMHFAASQNPTKNAVIFNNKVMTFSQIREETLRLANAFVRFGIQKGDRIGIALPNCPQYLITYYAALSAGAIIVNMNPLYTYSEIKFMVETTSPALIVTFDQALSTISTIAKESGLTTVIVTRLSDYGSNSGIHRDDFASGEKGFEHFSEIIENCKDTNIPKIKFDPEDGALIQFTGGTTGLPKGALLSHANMIAAVFQVSQWYNPFLSYTSYEERRTLIVIPLFHIYANLFMNLSVHIGATQVLLPEFDADNVLSTIETLNQTTIFPAVPTMLSGILNSPNIDKLKIGDKIKWINSGGAPIPLELVNKLKDLGISFGEGWGMSETTAVGVLNPVLGHKPGSIGVPIIDTEVRLVNLEDGQKEVPKGFPGEIIIKGPTVMQEYWNNPEETAIQFRNGWLYTGDIAQYDKDGYLYIIDRKKDMIIAGGFNIYPREVDEILYQHSKISEAVTVGIPDSYRGETVKVVITLKPGEMLSEKELIDFCKSKLAPYKVPKVVEFRDSIPKSAVGKILRKILRDEHIAKNNIKTTKKI